MKQHQSGLFRNRGKFQNFTLQTALEEANNPHRNFWRGKMPPSPGEVYQACSALAVFVNLQVLICGSQEEVSQAVMLQIQVRICSVWLRLCTILRCSQKWALQGAELQTAARLCCVTVLQRIRFLSEYLNFWQVSQAFLLLILLEIHVWS